MASNDRGGSGKDARGGKRGTYDDEELLRLLAEPRLTYSAIAKRLGLTRQGISRIARGESRPELQGRIRPLLERRPDPRRRKRYDDERLIELLGEPKNTYARIAREVGLSPGTVARIAGGLMRSELRGRIEAVNRGRAGAKPRRQYDDERLIRLLGDRSRTYTDIGREVGLSVATVGAIARGELRRELQERIRRVTRGISRGKKHKRYDDERLVMLIGRGDMTYAQIGAEVGLKPHSVGLIARGQSRPDLQPLIRAASQAYMEQTRRLAARMAPPVITRIFNLTSPEGAASAKVQLEAGETILRYALGGPGKADGIAGQEPAAEVPGVADEDVPEFYRYLSQRARWRQLEAGTRDEGRGTREDATTGGGEAPGKEGGGEA